jgi:hypothetical protein
MGPSGESCGVDHRLLLIGEPSAGASRTAYEAMARTFPTALVLAPNPDSPEAVQMLVEELEPSVLKKLPAQELIVLWLDRLEQHLPNGLAVRLLDQLSKSCRDRHRVLRVVATISSRAYGQWADARQEPLD